MKNILLLLLLSNFLQAQNVGFLQQANKADVTFARQFADSIASNYKAEYYFVDARESKKGDVYSVVYLPVSTSKETKDQVKSSPDFAYSVQCEECLKVNFRIIKEGENKDLGVTGDKKYMFNLFEGKFVDVFAFWQRNIEPSAVAEKVAEKGYSSLRDEKNKILFNLRKNTNSGLWYIQNYSDRLNQ